MDIQCIESRQNKNHLFSLAKESEDGKKGKGSTYVKVNRYLAKFTERNSAHCKLSMYGYLFWFCCSIAHYTRETAPTIKPKKRTI